MKLARLLVRLGLSLPVSLACAPLSQAADSIPSEHKEFFEQAFGYVPDNAEYTSYLEQFGSVPTDEEIALYLASSTSEEQDLQAQVTDQQSSHNAIETRSVWSNQYFSYGKWIGREVWSLSLMPRRHINASQQNASWNTVYARFNNNRHWSYYKSQGADQSMRKQFFCHARYGMIKVPWNLEPSRRPNSVNPVTCN